MVIAPFENIRKSKTYKVVCGCGNLYITCDYKDDKLHKVRLQRTSKLLCSLSVLDPLFRSVTFETRRDIRQAIKDHKGREDLKCKQFNIKVKAAMKKGELAAWSCTDAIARVLEKVLEENGGVSK
jgi:hypothetical protein